jgi:voltage-gated potassium channel
MPIYRVFESQTGKRHIHEWRRRAIRTVALLLVTVLGCSAGLVFLDASDQPMRAKAFTALWNAVNLITTLGDFNSFNERQKIFMIGAMFSFLIIGGYAISRLTGILSSNAAISYRENKFMERQLDRLTNHIVVIGFGPLGRLVAGRLRDAGHAVLIVDRADDLASEASEFGYPVVQGDAGVDDEVLDRSGVDRARALVVTTEDPDRKLAITLMAHARNPNLRIAVTGANNQRGALLTRAGASQVVIAEDLIAGALVARLGETPAE